MKKIQFVKTKTLFFCLLSVAFLFGCGSDLKKDAYSGSNVKNRPSDTISRLRQYWILADADNPMGKDVPQTVAGIELIPGMVFMNDGKLLENPGSIPRYGTFQYEGGKINAKFEDDSTAQYAIIRIDSAALWLERLESNQSTTLKYIPTHTWWPNSERNPFSKSNYQWTFKPDHPESDAAIKQRAKDCINFYAYYLMGFVNGQSSSVDFTAMPECFNFYKGGFTVRPASKLDPKWVNCFYNQEQALQARQMLEDAIRKKYTWDKSITNWVSQTIPVLFQYRDSL